MIETLKQFDLVYLGTPYSKYPKGIERAWTKACRIAAHLVKVGIKVYSPIAHTHPIAQFGYMDPLDYKIWLPFCDAMLHKSDAMAVCMMEGWNTSTGIAYEIEFFNKTKKPVFFINPELVGERP